MAEQAPLSAEQHDEHAEAASRPERQTAHEHRESAAEHAQQAEKAQQRLEQAQKKVHEEESNKAEAEDPIARLERQAAEQNQGGVTHSYVDHSLRKDSLNKQLQSIRRKLPARERVLSSIVHQPVVRAVSEAAGKTVSRPSGLLGGGLVAFIGSTGYLYFAKHFGFPYNSFVFVALFVIGFFVGLGLELAVWLATNSRRRHD